MREIQRRFAVDPTDYPFESRWLERGGVRMHYLDEGAGTPVLLLHGNPTWSYLYRHVILGLRAEARCIAPDYPGFGLSDHPPAYGYTPAEHAAWVDALINRLGLKRIVLVGQDWGGPIGFSVATARPVDFGGMVVLNTFCGPPDWGGRLFSMIMGGKTLGRYLQLKKNFFAKTIVPSGIFHKERITPALRRAYTDPFPDAASRMGTWVFPREIRRSAAWMAAIESRFHLLKEKPVRLVWARRDPAFGKRKFIDRWLSHFPQAELESLDDASHYLQEDRPDRIIDAIRRVLARIG